MSYELFQKRMKAKGLTVYERRMKNAQKSFDNYFETSISKEKVLIDDVECEAIFQDQNQSNNKDLSDDKYLIVRNETMIHVGSIVDWRKKLWLVFTEEQKTIPTHQQLKVKEANGMLKWMTEDGLVCGHGKGHPAYIQNQTLYTLGVSTSGNNSWIVNAKMMMYMPDDNETRKVRIGQRIFIGGAVYQVMFKDYVSRKGLIHYLLEEDFVNPEIDNIEEGIANYYDYIDKDNGDTKPDEGVVEFVISGSEKARIGSTFDYEVNPSTVDIVEWTIADTESIATVNEQTTKKISVRIVNNFSKVGNTITIIGKSSNGAIASKVVRIVSPY